MNHTVEPRPASTVALIRDGDDGIETLLLRRNKALLFAGGFWVFPGGALDPADIETAGGDIEQASRIAAQREAEEECGLEPALDKMVQLSHWTTPVVEPKRFYTWIYAAPVAVDKDVCIDGGEIHDSQWVGVNAAVAAHERGEFAMLPPTFITLLDLARFDSVAEFCAAERREKPPEILPVFSSFEEKIVVLFPGDAGYDNGDAARAGPRHRAILQDKHWEYVYQSGEDNFPPLLRC